LSVDESDGDRGMDIRGFSVTAMSKLPDISSCEYHEP
jgi:hypothetical protein